MITEWGVALGAAIIGVLFFNLYYGIVGYSMKRYGLLKHYKELDRKEKIEIIILLCGITVYFFYLSMRDERIVNWDNGFYWIKSLNFSEVLFSDPASALKQIYESIDLTDYSDVVPAIMSIPFLLMGRYSYDLYRLQLFLMFQIPVYILMTDIINRILKRLNIRAFKYSYLITMFFCVAVSFLYIPTVYGLFDIADLVIACAIILLLLEFDYCKFSLKDDLLLSLLFLALLFIRRHFSFFALGYFACFMLAQLIRVIRSRKQELLLGYVKNSCVVGGICVSVLVVFFRNYLIRTLGNNYSVQYAAWSNGTITSKYITTCKWMGMLIIGLCIVGCVAFLIKKQYNLAFVEMVSTVFIMYLFFRIQSPSPQHYYNFSPQVLIMMCTGLFFILDLIKNRKLRYVGAGIEAIIMGALFAHGMIPSVDLSNSLYLFSSFNYQPEVRNDFETIGQILEETQELANEKEAEVYCVASSGIINDDILKNYNLPEETDALPELNRTYNSDLANGFPTEFLTSDIIIATNPSQLHMNKDGQRIVWVLNEMILDEDGVFSDNFKIVKTYTIEDDVEVMIYQKIKDLTKEDYDYLIETFNEWYSDYPELFEERILKSENSKKRLL